MSSDFTTVNLTGSEIAGVLAVTQDSGSVLLFNTSQQNTVYMNDTEAFDTSNPSDNAPLPPLATLVHDGSKPVYIKTQTGQSAAVAVIPGGVSFFQLVTLIVKTLIVQASLGNGLFVYNGTGALGNPPIAAIVAPGTTTDPFGNTVNSVMNIGNLLGAHVGFDANGKLYLADSSGQTRIFIDPSITSIIFYDAGGQISGNVLMSLSATGGLSGSNTIVAGINLLQLPLFVNNVLSLFTGTVVVPANAFTEVLGPGSPVTQTFTATGAANFTVPAGVTALKVETWGPAGNSAPGSTIGAQSGGSTGGSGEYAAEPAYTVTPGQVIPYFIAAAGSLQSTTFNGTAVVAHAGANSSGFSGAPGGTGSSNTTHHDGAAGVPQSSFRGGEGGSSSAGPSNAGNSGASSTSNTGALGGAAVPGGGTPGNGGNTNTAGGNASGPGSSGGGGGGGLGAGAAGTSTGGQIKITYTPSGGVLLASTGTSQVDSLGNTLPAGNTVAPLVAIQPGTIITRESWHAASLNAGFAVGGTTPRYQFEPINGGRVRLTGAVNLVGAQGAGATIFTLPAAYRPASAKEFVTKNNLAGYALGGSTVLIPTSGNVTLQAGGNNTNFLLLDGICFELD